METNKDFFIKSLIDFDLQVKFKKSSIKTTWLKKRKTSARAVTNIKFGERSVRRKSTFCFS